MRGAILQQSIYLVTTISFSLTFVYSIKYIRKPIGCLIYILCIKISIAQVEMIIDRYYFDQMFCGRYYPIGGLQIKRHFACIYLMMLAIIYQMNLRSCLLCVFFNKCPSKNTRIPPFALQAITLFRSTNYSV